MDEIDKSVDGFEPLMGDEIVEGIRKIVKKVYRQMRWRQRYQHWKERIFRLYIRNVVLPNKKKFLKKIYHFKDKPMRRRIHDIYLGYGYFLRYYSDGTHELFYDPNLTGSFPFGLAKDYNDQGFPIF